MKWQTILILLALMLVPTVGAQTMIPQQTSQSELTGDFAYTDEVLLNQDPDPVEPGEYVELRWKVTKHGEEPVENLSYRLKTEYPFSLDPGRERVKNVGRWSGISGEENFYTLYYKLRVAESATEENYKITLEKTYGGENWQSHEYEVRVQEAKDPKLVLGQMRTSPQELQSDLEETKLTINLDNIGDEGAENVKTMLELPEGFTSSYSYSDESVLGTIPAGMGKPATFYLDIDEGLSSGVYSAKMNLRYKKAGDDDNNYYQKTLPFNVTLRKKPEFEITSFRIEPENVQPGKTVNLHLTIKNKGEEDAESVSVHAFKDTAQPFEFQEKSDYVGTLEGGESGEAVVTLNVDSEARPKKHMLDLEIRAIDDNEVIVEEKQVNLQVNQSRGSSPQAIIPLGLGAAVVLIGLGIYFLLKKR